MLSTNRAWRHFILTLASLVLQQMPSIPTFCRIVLAWRRVFTFFLMGDRYQRFTIDLYISRPVSRTIAHDQVLFRILRWHFHCLDSWCYNALFNLGHLVRNQLKLARMCQTFGCFVLFSTPDLKPFLLTLGLTKTEVILFAVSHISPNET